MARRGQGAGNRRGQGALMAVLVSRHAEPSAAADPAAMLASRDIMPKQAARLLSLVVKRLIRMIARGGFVDRTRRWLLIARFAEGIFGLCSLPFAFTYWVTFPPPVTHWGRTAFNAIYFLGGPIVAFGLVWGLRGKVKLAWYVAAALSAIVLLNSFASLPRWWVFLYGQLKEYVGSSVLIMPALLMLTQLVVAVCLFFTRYIPFPHQRTQETAV